MIQGDTDWRSLARAICEDDRIEATSHNLNHGLRERVRLQLGPVPCVGAIRTAPLLLLLDHPPLDPRATSDDRTFVRPGWPLAALHPDAPASLADWWRPRVATLVARFGAQHVANSIAAVYLMPWHAAPLPVVARFPSRARLLDVAADAAARDAVLLIAGGTDAWIEHPTIGALPPSRRVVLERADAMLTPANLGDAWDAICARIEVHAWM